MSQLTRRSPFLRCTLTGLGLNEDLVEAAPKPVKEAIAKDAAEDTKKQLEKLAQTVKSSNRVRVRGQGSGSGVKKLGRN